MSLTRRHTLATLALPLLPATPRAQTAADLPPWRKLPTVAYNGKQDDVFFVDPLAGWYGNGAGRLYRTTDGGQTWSPVWTQPGTFVRALGFVDAQHGFLGNVGTDYFPGVTDTQPLYETRDGGVTWHPVGPDRVRGGPVKGLCAIDILRPDGAAPDAPRVIHAAGRVGGPGVVMRSLDTGRTWTVLDLGTQVGAILDVKFFDARRGLVCAGSDADVARSNALILRTDDGGATWRTVYRSARPFELTWKASFPTPDVGYVTVQSYDPDPSVSRRVLAKTVDGGETWREIDLVDNATVRQFGVGFVSPRVGWVGTTAGGFQTLDGGQTWRRVDIGRVVNKIRFLPTPGGWVGHAIGADVYRLTLDAAAVRG